MGYEDKNYYIVCCRGGHVGRRYYYPINFAVTASSKKEAAAKARQFKRVKRDHKNCIIDCFEVDYETYKLQLIANNNNPYLLVKSRHEQNQIMHLIKDQLVFDDYYLNSIQPRKKSRKPNLIMQSAKYQIDIDDFEY